MTRITLWTGAAVALGSLLGIWINVTIAAEISTRSILVEDVRNEQSPFAVRVEVDHPDRIYEGGDTLSVRVQSERDGYLYLLDLSPDQKLTCLFPNHVQPDNRIAAKASVTIPATNADFRLRVGPPFGPETLTAIVTAEPIELSQLGVQSLTAKALTPLKARDVKSVFVELKKTPAVWAEHRIDITTLAKKAIAEKTRRVALFVGVREYEDQHIPTLTVSDKDAKAMAAAMKQVGQLDDVEVLVNRQATLKNLRQAICTNLVAKTKPGDCIFIYWSGHGGRCARPTGNEPGAFSEYLVPYDGHLGNMDTIRRTMLLDDTFGRWVQDLDGRKVILVLDTCYSAGQAAGQKGIGPRNIGAEVPFHNFLDRHIERTKDIGQKETAILASAKASQQAFERWEGDMSVMTYVLVNQLKAASGKVSLHNAYENVKAAVPEYVRAKFAGATQDPLLVDNTTPPVYLRP